MRPACMHAPRAGLRLVALGMLAGLLLSLPGCAAHVPPPPPVGLSSTLPRVALMPLENLSSRADGSDRVSRVLVGVLGESRTCQPVQPADIDQVFTRLRIRDASGVTRDRVPELAAQLDAQWLMAGTILEYGLIKTPEGEVPSVGLTLRLIDGRDGRTAWSAMRVRTGEDRETVFGFGRVRSLDQLTERLAREILANFRLPAPGDTTANPGGPR
jgi:hypothetical protein